MVESRCITKELLGMVRQGLEGGSVAGAPQCFGQWVVWLSAWLVNWWVGKLAWVASWRVRTVSVGPKG